MSKNNSKYQTIGFMIINRIATKRGYVSFLFCYLFFLLHFTEFVYANHNGFRGPTPFRTPTPRISTRDLSDNLSPKQIPSHLIDHVEPTSFEHSPIKLNLIEGKDQYNTPKIGGPSQPEMASFKSVGTDNMVDNFTGDFSYNIPLLDVGGYPVNIFYNSGITMDQEASWVGLGWNINPGTISRNMRGIPDDFDGTRGDIITKELNIRPEVSIGLDAGLTWEAFGLESKSRKLPPPLAGISANAGLNYSNKYGLAMNTSLGVELGISKQTADPQTEGLSASANLSLNSQTGAGASFGLKLSKEFNNNQYGSLGASIDYSSRQGLQALHLTGEYKKYGLDKKSISQLEEKINESQSATFEFARPSFTPTIRNRFRSQNYSIRIRPGFAKAGFFKTLAIGASYIRSSLVDRIQQQPAFGMIHLEKSMRQDKAVTDFNRVHDVPYVKNSPIISVPHYTYDIFSITGEGISGSFRAYRRDLGSISEPTVENPTTSASAGFDFGGTHFGANANVVFSPSYSQGWTAGNLAKEPLRYQASNGEFTSVFFRNPGEMAIQDKRFQQLVGDDDLVRFKFSGTGLGNPTVLPSLVRYNKQRQLMVGRDTYLPSARSIKEREKRMQVISFLSAEEASLVGLDKEILSYNNPTDIGQVSLGCGVTSTQVVKFPRFSNLPIQDEKNTHKRHHISQVNVLMPDGKNYVYGIPVMNTRQVEVTFGAKGNTDESTLSYNREEREPSKNKYGKDHYVERQTIPAYAHSFLLTGLTSPNYVDITGDGITEDDLGDAVKFNYSKQDRLFKWRTPFGRQKATFNAGLRTDDDDDKGNYVYGEREMWYLYSIESKNLVARFYIKNDRRDSKSVIDEDGGIDASFGAQRLDKIALFSKADLVKHGSQARPIKTVHFEYDYSLCPSNPTNDGTAAYKDGALIPRDSVTHVSSPIKNINFYRGKLTLKAIYFTYNGNTRQKKNYYRFYYPEDQSGNPAYTYEALDRWGNYKPNSVNPGGVPNSVYPYVCNDRHKSNLFAAAWTLNRISLPSGATIQVEYEADDYGFVQNRRASSMFQILGLGNTPTPTANQLTDLRLYGSSDHEYIYVKVPEPIRASDAMQQAVEIKSKYLGNFGQSTQIALRLGVKMKNHPRGRGYEMIPIYFNLVDGDFGVVPQSNNAVLYFRARKLESGYSPMVQHSIQFVRDYMSFRAFPTSDLSGRGVGSVVRALVGMLGSFGELFRKGLNGFKAKGLCRDLTGNSYIRLTDPTVNKVGGGLRVKRVTISDNFDKLSAKGGNRAAMPAATYGQEYIYTKTELIGNELKQISSGVAAWEPGIGSEENPFREMLQFFQRQAMGPYNYASIEAPIGETFYSTPQVGYSRVETRSIHRDTVKNAASISVSEYYTAREFPTESSYTPLEADNATDFFRSGNLARIFRINFRTAVALSQGFKVETNDMHGKLRRQSVYSPLDLKNPISYTENFYNTLQRAGGKMEFYHNLPVLKSSDGVISTHEVIGRDIEITTDFREHVHRTIGARFSPNVDVISPFLFFFNLFRTFTAESKSYRSASLMKLVKHFGVLDSVVVFDKGSLVSTKNLVYDGETGAVLLTRTYNQYKRPVYNFSYPAHWAYSGMAPAYKNIDVTYPKVTFIRGRIMNHAGIDFNLFESGDELLVIPSSTKAPEPNQPCEPEEVAPTLNVYRIWAINLNKQLGQTPDWIFVDDKGNAFTGKDTYIRIIRSGKRNLSSNPVGTITTLSNPVSTLSSGELQLVFNQTSKVVQTGVQTYKDVWKVDPQYEKQLVPTNNSGTNLARVKHARLRLTPSLIYNLQKREAWGNGGVGNDIVTNGESILSSAQRDDAYGKWQRLNRSLVQFDLTPLNNFLGSTRVLYKAMLTLHPHTDSHPDPLNRPEFQASYHNTLNPYSPGVWQTISLVTGPWFPATEVSNLFGAYMESNVNLGNHAVHIPPVIGNHLSYNLFVPSGTNIPIDKRIDLTQLLKDNKNTPLGMANKLALAFHLKDDLSPANYQFDPGSNHDYPPTRCYDGNTNNLNSRPPTIEVYYYECGDTSTMSYELDPIINQVIKCPNGNPHEVICKSRFSDGDIFNPYTTGIWGNWRPDTSFVYYGERAASDAIGPIDLRTAGSFKSFDPFWSMGSNRLQRVYPIPASWTWTSKITQFNSRGLEVENKDPLGRFKSALYGFNEQLPIAISDNARYRETYSNGFEDYDYRSSSCGTSCNGIDKIDFNGIRNFLSQEAAHSGKSSIKLTPNSPKIKMTIPVQSESTEESFTLSGNMTNTSLTGTFINPQGDGFKLRYKLMPFNSSVWSQLGRNKRKRRCQTNLRIMHQAFSDPNGWDESIDPGTLESTYLSLPQKDKIIAQWVGYYQPKVDETVRFRISGTYVSSIKIESEGYTEEINRYWSCDEPNAQYSTRPLRFKAGTPRVYKFTINVGSPFAGIPASISLKRADENSLTWSDVDVRQIYSPDMVGSASNAVIQDSTITCSKYNGFTSNETYMNNQHSLLPDKKMIVSGWVKQGNTDCACSTYAAPMLFVRDITSGQILTRVGASGPIIEGWQRIEAEFTTPASGNNVDIELSTSSNAVSYFDDIRIHPARSNMRSFVYNPINLRLEAQLDENNYATFFEYDDDGTLTRTKKETVRGVKTINETRSSLQKSTD